MSAAATRSISDETPIRIGVSSCLLGHPVRYDGGHKRDGFLVDTFGRYVQWVPVCPEMELGLGVPRPTLRLERVDTDVRLRMPATCTDYTEAMQRYAARRVARLAGDELCGYILKSSSPSCGMERVKVYGTRGMPAQNGRGLFAEALFQRFPLLPIEEEGRLCDPRLRDNFVERVFAYRRLHSLFATQWRIGDLVAFHTAHKLQLLAHAPATYQRLGRLVAQAKSARRTALRKRYETIFMEALAVLATARRHVNVLQHMAGYLKQQLDAASRQELASLIEAYGAGLVPLIVPITLLQHHVRRFNVTYLKGQTYMEPHPKELMLRNHV